MTLTIDFWNLLTYAVGLLIAFFAAAFAAGGILLSQVEKRLSDQFSAQEKARKETKRHWDERFSALEAAARQEARRWQSVERELLQLKADLPLRYVLRDDYVRNQSVIEAKLDGMALRIENAIFKGDRNG
jgi:hypothetical protein